MTWAQKRRGELLDLFRSENYGAAPPKPTTLSFQVAESDPQAINGQAKLKRVTIANFSALYPSRRCVAEPSGTSSTVTGPLRLP
jgi:hypothetical protein